MAEPWIRVHARLIDKPIVARLCAACKVKPLVAVGLLATFWGSVSANASNGDVSQVADELLERWASWAGTKGLFAGWIRAQHTDAAGRIREWDAYQGALETRRERERERLQRWRNAQRPPNGTHDETRTDDVANAVRNAYETRTDDVSYALRTHPRARTGRYGTERNYKEQQLSGPAIAVPAGTAWLDPLLAVWQTRVGPVKPKRAAAALGPVQTLYGPDDTLAGLTAYLDEPRHPDKPVRLEFFAADAARWIEEAKAPLVRDGVVTARGERVSRP